MQQALYVAMSAQSTLLTRLEAISENVAGASTPGFHATAVAFQTVTFDHGNERTAFSRPSETRLETQRADVRATGHAFDVALDGDGWIGVETTLGRGLSRDGRLAMSPSGELRTVTGHAVLDAGGAPIRLDPSAGAPTISRTGLISQGDRVVASLGLFRVPIDAKLTRGPDGTVVSSVPPVPVDDGLGVSVRQGVLEGSNVSPQREISRLISVQRLFDAVMAVSNQTETSMLEGVRQLGGGS